MSDIRGKGALHATALKLGQRGINVFPCRPRDKRPATTNGCLDATTEAGRINDWWTAQTDCNVGIATGAGSGIFVLDIDGQDGEASLRQLECKHGSLPPSIEAITGSGGRHVYFRYPTGQEVRNSAKQIGAGLDIRGTRGYVVSPPSVHPSGRRYRWSVDCANNLLPPRRGCWS